MHFALSCALLRTGEGGNWDNGIMECRRIKEHFVRITHNQYSITPLLHHPGNLFAQSRSLLRTGKGGNWDNGMLE